MKIKLRPKITFATDLSYDESNRLLDIVVKSRAAKYILFYLEGKAKSNNWNLVGSIYEIDSDYIKHPEDYYIDLPT